MLILSVAAARFGGYELGLFGSAHTIRTGFPRDLDDKWPPYERTAPELTTNNRPVMQWSLNLRAI